jgi:hypothetical protein
MAPHRNRQTPLDRAESSALSGRSPDTRLGPCDAPGYLSNANLGCHCGGFSLGLRSPRSARVRLADATTSLASARRPVSNLHTVSTPSTSGIHRPGAYRGRAFITLGGGSRESTDGRSGVQQISAALTQLQDARDNLDTIGTLDILATNGVDVGEIVFVGGRLARSLPKPRTSARKVGPAPDQDWFT